LVRNYEGATDLLSAIRSLPKYGNAVCEVDMLVAEISDNLRRDDHLA